MSAEPEEKILFNINNSPHVRDPDTTSNIMFTVCLALVPALVWALLVFGYHALIVVVSTVAACVITESVCVWWRGVPNTVRDGSAIVTGLLLAAVSPPNLPWWSAALGGVFAIAIAKQVFGGLGHNVWNPALLARAFMQISMPERMMSGEWPHMGFAGQWWKNLVHDLGGGFAEIGAMVKSAPDAVTNASMAFAIHDGVDIMTGATALERMHSPSAAELVDQAGTITYLVPDSLNPTWREIFFTWFGVEGGTIGEVSAVLLIAGGIYLIYRKIVNWQIPAFYIGTVAVLGFVLPHPYKVEGAYAFTGWFHGPWLMHLGAGGLMLGAFFMATDMVTNPLTPKGKIIFAIGCGCMTMMIRLFAGYPEGVCYAILFMNTFVPLIDNCTKPRVFGVGKKK